MKRLIIASSLLFAGCSTVTEDTNTTSSTQGIHKTQEDTNTTLPTTDINKTQEDTNMTSSHIDDNTTSTPIQPIQETNTTIDIDDTNVSNGIDTTDDISKDTTLPIITLKYNKNILLDITQHYIEYGASASDNIDGNLTSKIDIQNNIIEGVEGNYSVIYKVQDSAGNEAQITRYVVIKDKLKELDTSVYKQKWFDKAKELWNKQNPNNQYTYEYYSYKFPSDGDRVDGTPPNNPITPKEWMQTAGLGFSKFLKYPFEDSKYQYTDAQVKEWKSKGFRNGRLHVPLYAMVDLHKDPTGATLKQKELKKIRDICRLFVQNNIPVTISIVSGDELSDGMKDDREETFRRTIEWWRQLSSYFKDESYLIAFENYVEYHGFDDVLIEKKDFKVKLNNDEVHYKGFKNYKKLEITNWVRNPGYNNLMAEIAKVVRLTNPKRIFIYKPNGIGRAGMGDITPWRWGSEGDYLGINNDKTPYWLISSGGSANLKMEYIQAIRSISEDEKNKLLQIARDASWGPAMDYYNATKIPVWISLFGIKADEKKVDRELGGVDVTTDELVSYIDWYQRHIQNDAIDENGKHIKLSSGFQQINWVWDFKNQTWLEGTLNDRWEHFERVWQTLSKWANNYK